jgi:pimeloyl-ACP methyl ester carboxylesterase
MDAPAAAEGSGNGGKHIVLVHGASLGGWSWFKVATPLRAAGYRVDTPDLAASGVDPRPLREVPTFRDYTQPLLDLLASLPEGHRVVLVGHSLGGVNVALAAETFPDKVAAVVFLCAFMPDCTARPSHVMEKVRGEPRSASCSISSRFEMFPPPPLVLVVRVIFLIFAIENIDSRCPFSGRN